MRLRYTSPALADLDAILEYIGTHSPKGAVRVKARIQAVLDLLLSYPHIGATTDDPTIRRLNTTPYPYRIFYEIADEEIVVHAVRHAAGDPSNMPGSTT